MLIIPFMKEVLGLDPEEKGVCVGLAIQALMSFILGDEKYQLHSNRLKAIDHIQNDEDRQNLKRIISNSETMKSIKKQSPEVYQNYIDMIAFLTAVDIGHEPWKYPQLFPKNKILMNQNLSLIAPLVQSKAMEQEGGLVVALQLTGVYSNETMDLYLQVLSHHLMRAYDGARVALLMGIFGHALMLAYDEKNFRWIIESHGKNDFVLNVSIENLRKTLKNAFNINEESLCLLSTKICTSDVKFECHLVDRLVDEIQKDPDLHKVHEVTREKSTFSDKRGFTWLHMAAKQGDIQSIIKLLNENPASIDSKNNKGFTPLLMAIGHGNLEAVKKLLSANANVGQVTHKGKTGLYLAAFHGHVSIVDYFFKNHNESPEEVKKAVKIVKQTINQTIEMSKEDLLKYAKYHGKLKKLEEYIDLFDIQGPTLQKFSALDVAIFLGHQWIAEKLLEEGATITQPHTLAFLLMDESIQYPISSCLTVLNSIFFNIVSQVVLGDLSKEFLNAANIAELDTNLSKLEKWVAESSKSFSELFKPPLDSALSLLAPKPASQLKFIKDFLNHSEKYKKTFSP